MGTPVIAVLPMPPADASGATRLELAHPLPVWAWVFVAAGAAAVSWWAYRRLLAPRWARVGLGTLRALSLLAIAVLLAGPRVSESSQRTEPDRILVLADRSASMTIPDGPGRETRDAQLRAAVAAIDGATAARWPEDRTLWLGFGAGAFGLERAGGAIDAGEPDGPRSALGVSLEQALRRAAGRPLAGVVVLSDGRWSDAVPREVLRRLEAERVGVYAVPLGSPEPRPDLAIAAIDAPDAAFIDDTVRVGVELRSTAETPHGGIAELVNTRTGEVLDRQDLAETPIDPADPRTRRVVLRTTPREPGRLDLAVRLSPEPPDLLSDNNERTLSIELPDRPLRVLYLDGTPRWERRYLTSLLLRERSIESASLLLASSRRFIQEGDRELIALPASAEDWAAFDVVMLGDLSPDQFAPEQLEQLRTHIADRGGGLLWIAGPGFTPAAWARTALADLLPMSLPPDGAGAAVWDRPVTMTPAPPAERLGLLNLRDDGAGWPPALSDPATGWSLLRWALRLTGATLKPAAEALALGTPEAGDAEPLVVTMRFGAGRVVLVGTDETWRWRYGRGEDLQERFWLPILRLLGRESLARAGRPATLTVLPRDPLAGTPAAVELRIEDQSLLSVTPERVAVEIAREGEPPRTIDLTSDPADPAVRRGSWTPADPGEFDLRASLAGLPPEAAPSRRVRVERTDDELRRPETDHAALASLAAATGGRVLGTDELAGLPELLPNRSLQIATTPRTTPLWDRGWVLALLVSLLALEWIGRRLVRLA
jgi:hypothetical protein